MDVFIITYMEHNDIVWQTEKISEKHHAFKDQNGDIKKVVIVRRRLIGNLYAQQYSANFGVYYDIVDPIVRSTKKL